MFDESRALSERSPNDPHRLLSRESHIRISDAYLLQKSIRDRAEALVYARCGDELDGAARQQLSEARMEAAVGVLRVKCEEFMNVGIQGPELWGVMQGELEGAANSIGLSADEIIAVRSTLATVRKPSATKPPTSPAGRKPSEQANGEKLRRYRGDKSQEWLAAAAEVSEDTIQRGEAGGRWAESTFDAVAKALAKETGLQITGQDLK